jgi:L-alanine-DL-glutamate epimerase-like enolase superfamily enzyme
LLALKEDVDGRAKEGMTISGCGAFSSPETPMIEDVELFRLEVPLRKPYKLAFGPVHHFDTILVRVIADGRAGFGEATILTGYTDEDIEGSWRLTQSLAGSLCGLSLPAAKAALADAFPRVPFTATAFTTAIEWCEGSALPDVPTSTEVLILAGIEETTAPGLEAGIERHLAAGFRALKVKVGFDPDLDAARVKSIQRVVGGRARLRSMRTRAFVRASMPVRAQRRSRGD